MTDKTEWFSEDIDRYVAAAVVIRDGAALVLRRKPDDFMGGTWELPSGKADAGETIEQALARELAEETGLTLRSVRGVLGTFDYASRSGRATRQVNFAVEAAGSELRLTEHDAAEWVSADRLPALEVTPETREVLRAAFAAEAAR